LADNTHRKAAFLGGESSLTDFITNELDFSLPFSVKQKKDSVVSIVSFSIDQNGIVRGENKMLDAEAIRIAMLTDRHWIPAVHDSKRVDATHKIRFCLFFKRTPEQRSIRLKFGSVE